MIQNDLYDLVITVVLDDLGFRKAGGQQLAHYFSPTLADDFMLHCRRICNRGSALGKS
jgi:hypothetical protein